jgi:hypothetical protein
MPSTDLFTQYWPAWLSLAVAVLLVVNKLIEESTQFAQLFGRLGRKIHAYALTRHHIDLAANEFAEAVQRAVEAARDEWEQEENEAIAALDRRLRIVSQVTAGQATHITELLDTQQMLKAYGEYEGLWHNVLRDLAGRAPDGRIRLADLPEHVTLYSFETQYNRDPKWREWING